MLNQTIHFFFQTCNIDSHQELTEISIIQLILQFQEKVDTLTAASTVVTPLTPSQNAPPNENFIQHQSTATTTTSNMGNPNQHTVGSIALFKNNP